MLDTLFMDQIYANIEHMQRLNQVVDIAPAAVPGLHKVATLVIAPSADLRVIAAQHIAQPAARAARAAARHGCARRRRRAAGQLPDVRVQLYQRADRSSATRMPCGSRRRSLIS